MGDPSFVVLLDSEYETCVQHLRKKFLLCFSDLLKGSYLLNYKFCCYNFLTRILSDIHLVFGYKAKSISFYISRVR